MRRLIAVLVPTIALFTLACGNEAPTDPGGGIEPAGDVASAVEVVGGAGQSVEVGRSPADSIAVRITNEAGDPMQGRLVSFEVLGGTEGECGSWGARSLQTNANGRAFNIPTTGRVADTRPPDCRYRVSHSVEGRDVTLTADVGLDVRPGPVEQFPRPGDTDSGSDVPSEIVSPLEDRFSNPSPWRLEVTGGPFTVQESTAGVVQTVDTTASEGWGRARALHSDTVVADGVVGWRTHVTTRADGSADSAAAVCIEWGRDSASADFCKRVSEAIR